LIYKYRAFKRIKRWR